MSLLDRIFPTSRTADRLEERAEVQRAYRKGVERGKTESRSTIWSASEIWGRNTFSGERVTEERSLGISAVYAAVMILANTTASLPLKLFRRRSDGGKEEARDHPLYRVLHAEGNSRMSAYKLRQAWMVHMLLWGNSYSELETNEQGDVIALWPINPRRVEVKSENNRTTYRIWLPSGRHVNRSQDRILHISNLGFDGVEGKSPITLFRETLGITLAAEKYGANFFRNDARPGMTLLHPGRLSETAHANLKRDLHQQQAGAENAWRPQILEEGMKIETIGLPPGDAQFLETRGFGILEVARIFNVPPHMLAELTRATFSNIEEQSLSFVTKSLRERLVNIEQEVNRRLLTEVEKRDFFAEHSIEGLLRGDIQSRFEAYATARNWGWMSANDIRKIENLNPIPDGDTYLQPLNMVPSGTEQLGPVGGGGVSSRAEFRQTESVPPRYRIAQGLVPMIRDVFGRANRREVAELRNAIDRYLVPGNTSGFQNFLQEFEAEHAEWLMERGRILPLYQTFAEQMAEAAQQEIGGQASVDDQFVRDYSEAYANRHVGSTRGQLEALLGEDDPEEAVSQRLNEWEGDEENPSRADKEAENERVRGSNAFTKAAWAAMGVQYIRWRTVGENCPMCDSLNGAIVEITRFFLNAGDTIFNSGGSNIVSQSSIGHPPLHQGCDCYLSASISRKALTPREIRKVKDMILERPELHTNGVHV